MKNSSKYLLLFIAIFSFTTSCKDPDYSGEVKELELYPLKTDISYNRINFYLENSGSMNPYTEGTTDFNLSLIKLLRDIELLQPDTIQIFAANTKIHPLNQDISAFSSSLTKQGIPSVGNIHDSDLNLIFENILDNHNKESISILVTDAIYSVKGSKDQLLQNLQTEVYKTRNNFVGILNKEDLATLCLKLSSNYDGYYYPASDPKIKINQMRPYYLWIFGESKVLKKFMEETNVLSLPGFEEYFYRIKNQKNQISYSILQTGPGKTGNFRNEKKYPVHTIIKAERSNRPNSKGEFGFAVAVDLSNLPLPEKHLMDIKNYSLTTEDYEILEIIKVDNLTAEDREIVKADQNKINGVVNFTHILKLKSESKFLQTFDIKLNNELPKWISETGVDEDSEIEGNTTQTFGFDKLATGITEAYKMANKNKEIFSITLNVK